MKTLPPPNRTLTWGRESSPLSSAHLPEGTLGVSSVPAATSSGESTGQASRRGLAPCGEPRPELGDSKDGPSDSSRSARSVASSRPGPLAGDPSRNSGTDSSHIRRIKLQYRRRNVEDLGLHKNHKD